MKNKGYLLLEDGTRFNGYFPDQPMTGFGEVVFNTALSGYQEVLFDPSYWGQMVVMTYPHIGSVGVNRYDEESTQIYLNGFIIRSYSSPSNYRSQRTLKDLLHHRNIPLISEIDTRSLTYHLRDKGCMRGGIFTPETNPQNALEQVQAQREMTGLNGAVRATCPKPYDWTESSFKLNNQSTANKCSSKIFRVAVWDFGVKWNILRRLVDIGASVRVFPLETSISEILEWRPDGLLLSNGPGDPAAVTTVINDLKQILGKIPIFGICLGHQLLALAAGAKTTKMKFGHRGINHPVAEHQHGKIFVTVHNHGFAVVDDSLPKCARVTLRSLNDGTIEGLDFPDFNAFSVQFHPESSPGPHDASDLFVQFRERILGNAGKN